MTRQFNNWQIWVKGINLYMIFIVFLKVLDFKSLKYTIKISLEIAKPIHLYFLKMIHL